MSNTNCLSYDFQIPTNLLEQVYNHQVHLEHLFTRNLTIYGTVRVHNHAFDKQVFIKLTNNQWKTSFSIETFYSTHYADNNTDSFVFKYTLSTETNLSFVICYRVNHEEFWDNNFNQNYTIFLNRKSFNIDKQLAQDYRSISNHSQHAVHFCGLKNLQGTCYMNSILQSLFLTIPFRNYILSKKHFHDILINEFSNLFHLLSSKIYDTLIPLPFKQILGYIKNDYFNDEQQDAHEFLIYLIDYLQKDLKIDDLFHGTYQSILTCSKCSKTFDNFESFTCLNLPIPFENQCTLDDCFRYFQIEEYLTENSSWFCSQCHSFSSVKKRFQITKSPKILIIQLKRFQLDDQMNWIKNDTLVYYPEDNFNLFENSLYTLYSVVNHNGSLNDGHYTTYSRDLSLNSHLWFEFDDDIIEYLPNEKLHSNSKAYLLFYIRKST